MTRDYLIERIRNGRPFHPRKIEYVGPGLKTFVAEVYPANDATKKPYIAWRQSGAIFSPIVALGAGECSKFLAQINPAAIISVLPHDLPPGTP